VVGAHPGVTDIEALTHELLDALNEQNIRPSPKPKPLTAEVISAFERGGAGQDAQTHISPKVDIEKPARVEKAEPTRRLSIDLPESLHRRFKTVCS
jgi:hypothetical protein